MAVKYLCCDCDFDMTQAVVDACNQGPDIRAALVPKDVAPAHPTVILTCPDGHTCRFSCPGASA